MELMEKLKKLHRDESGLQQAVGIVMALIMIIVVGSIGIFIADTTQTAVGTPAQANLSAMNTNFLEAGQTGSSFIVILIIAFIGGIAIMYLMGMFGRGRMK